ncbi:hypothetical protein [Heyndrickxia camelliae]|nr:hypothetical protein [Heyndrickxia camelliae]
MAKYSEPFKMKLVTEYIFSWQHWIWIIRKKYNIGSQTTIH